MNSWKKYKLKDIGTIKTGKTPSSSIQEAYSDNGIPFVTPKDMKGYKWILSTERYLSEKGVNNLYSYLVKKNSIGVSCIGSDMGKAVLLKHRSITNQQINTIEVNDQHNFEFIYYKLSLMQDFFKSIAGGSATPILNKSSFSEIEIELPNLDTQTNLVEYIKYLDEKIQLNTQINQTLEQIAQTIFKSWFIDFDPVRAKATALAQGKTEQQATRATMEIISGKNSAELDRLQTENPTEYQQLHHLAQTFPSEFEIVEGFGNVPKGWKVEPLDKQFGFIGGAQPPKSQHIYEEQSGYERFIQNRDYSNNNHKTYIPISKKNKHCEEKDILMDKYGEAGKVRYGIKGAYNVALAKIVPKIENMREFLRWYFMQDSIQAYLSQASMASTRNSLNSSTFTGMEVTIPEQYILNSFEEMVGVYIDKSLQIKQENNSLIELRDYLLPKLLNGAIEL